MASLTHAGFPTTRWFLIVQACDAFAEGRRAALTELLRAYTGPVRSFVARRPGVRPDQVDDIVHDFLVLKWLDKDFLERANPAKGRFRSFLMVALSRHVSNHLRAQRVRAAAGLGPESDPSSDDADPMRAFEREWARGVVANAICQMERECRQVGRSDLWEVFRSRVLDPATLGHTSASYGELVARCGFDSPMQAANALVTAKRMFVRILRNIIHDMEGMVGDTEQEVRELLQILAGA